MPFDTQSLPVSGGVIIAAGLYAGLSIFALGPLIAERTIARSGWAGECERAQQSAIEAQRAPPHAMAGFDCRSTMIQWMPELAEFCSFVDPATDLLRQQERLRREAEDRRLAQAAAQSASQCACAASVVAQDRAWAIHAGSARLITPTVVKQLSTELSSAMHGPHCAGRVGS